MVEGNTAEDSDIIANNGFKFKCNKKFWRQAKYQVRYVVFRASKLFSPYYIYYWKTDIIFTLTEYIHRRKTKNLKRMT